MVPIVIALHIPSNRAILLDTSKISEGRIYMAHTVDTLLELYDGREPITNVAGAWHLQPKNIVYFYYDLKDPKAERKELAQMFNRIGLRCNVRMEKLERLDSRGMMDWVQAHQDELGDYAIDLTGGSDVMLFSAGVAYASTPCRLYTRTRDGRYIELPSGEAVEAGGGRMVAINRNKQGPDSLYNCIERGWKFYAERDWLAGVFYWTGFDYRGEPNPMVFPATSSEFGILDYCGFPKDEAYYLKSWWTKEPVLHILPHWNLDGHDGEKISVWVYSNCDEVQLIVNGKKLERKKMPLNGHLEWDATYRPGYVKAVGYRNGRKVMEKHLDTTGEATAFAVECEAVGDVAVVSVELKDGKGRFVPTACNDLSVTVGEGWSILGWGNGDPAFQYVERPVKYGPSAAVKTDPSLSVSGYGTPVPDLEARTMQVKAFNGLVRIFLRREPGSSLPADLVVSSNCLNISLLN